MNNLDQVLKSLSQEFSVAELKRAYEQLSQAYRTGTKIRLNHTLQCLAYAHARMPATVAVLTRVLEHLEHQNIHSLLDLGSGPGSVLWATQDHLPALTSALCLDQSKELLAFSKRLIDASDLNINATWKTYDLASHHIESCIPSEQKFDLVTLSYVLNELDVSHVHQIIQMSWNKTRSFLVIVEPGIPKGFNTIKQCRDILIQAGAHIIAPCTHANTCPMQDNDWCHFNTRLTRSKIHQSIKGNLPYEDEKYSFLIVSKESFPVTGSRVVKKPTQSSGLIELDLCNSQGLSRQKISKRQADTYKQAKKIQWGDRWE